MRMVMWQIAFTRFHMRVEPLWPVRTTNVLSPFEPLVALISKPLVYLRSLLANGQGLEAIDDEPHHAVSFRRSEA
jgi:hypothetical protein